MIESDLGKGTKAEETPGMLRSSLLPIELEPSNAYRFEHCKVGSPKPAT